MPRGPRVDFPGAVHHVYARGIEKRPIYLDDVDRKSFLDRIGNNLPKWGMRCLAWSLMPNHFHLLLQSDKGCLPSFMHCLLTGYSIRFNERHQRVGHLFFRLNLTTPGMGRAGYEGIGNTSKKCLKDRFRRTKLMMGLRNATQAILERWAPRSTRNRNHTRCLPICSSGLRQ